jgi:hypothetical protein
LSSKIRLDRYIYEDIYPAFKTATDEKEITAGINRAFLNYLAGRNVVLTGRDPAIVADIGCGPCDTLIKYLRGVAFAPGFIVRATDYIPEYADFDRGEAAKALAAAQAGNVIKLVAFETRAGNAFAGDLLGLLAGPPDRERMRRAFSLVFASHVMYHADEPAEVERLLGDISDNILARDGICILYHLAATPRTFQEFRARFGGNAGTAHLSDTGAVTIDDPPAQIRAACAKRGLPHYEAEFITNLHFGPLGDDEWRSFNDPRTYDALAISNPGAYEDLKRLYFVVQRAPLEFAADESVSGLKAFTNEIRRVIEDHRGVLPLAERIQVFTRSDADPAIAEAIPLALQASVTS